MLLSNLSRRCPTGYHSAESLYICAADGSFLGFEPTCKLADCRQSLASKAADISRNFSDCSDMRAGNVCLVPCAYGYEGQASEYTCLGNGTLHGFENPCSLKVCRLPSALMESGVRTSCFGARHGETCVAECQAGFGGLSSQLRCADGMLQGSLPDCVGFECSLESVRLEPGMDASDCVGKRTFETCSLKCQNGYSGSSSSQMTCSTNGRFTPSQGSFQCVPKLCGDLSAVPAFSAAEIAHSCDGLGFGGICSAFCQEGWALQGNATVLVCDDAPISSSGFSVYFESTGSYVNALEAGGPQCQALPCTANMPNLPGIRHNCAGKTTNESCLVEAAAGYHFDSVHGQDIQAAMLFCQADGSFSGNIPVVLADSCPAGQFGSGVRSTCVNSTTNSQCWAYCESGWSGTPRRYRCGLNNATDALELLAVEEDINCTRHSRRLADMEICSDDAAAAALHHGGTFCCMCS